MSALSDVTAIGFDADDTLWHNETHFRLTERHFAALLADHADPDHLMERLLAAERRNLGRYGFGVKGFVLSMIETAIEVTDARVPAPVIAEILAAGRQLLETPVQLLPHAREAVMLAKRRHRVMLITKGDLLDQERKIAQSGLGDLFDAVEVVSAKNAEVYARLFARHGHGAERAAMIGNSQASDIRPMLQAGGWAVFVPHADSWALEHAPAPHGHPRYRELQDLGGLAALLPQV